MSKPHGSTPTLSAATIGFLADAQGIPLTGADMAERLAAGAAAAIAVVREQLTAGADPIGNPVCDYEPGDFLPTLERLADEAMAAPAATPGRP